MGLWQAEIHPFDRLVIEASPLDFPYYAVRRVDSSPHATIMKDLLHSVQTTFCIHLIAISGPRRRPQVRMLFVATAGADAVYEAQGSWSQCIRLIMQLPSSDFNRQALAALRQEFGRDQYATLPSVQASFLDLETLGLQRVDR